MKIIHKIETYTSDGKPVLRFTVMNSSGAYMEFTNWGARWITASVPDVQGALANILIGYDTLSDYLKDSYYMGATVGRFANRIADASFTIDRKTFHLEVNDGNNTNHGGFSGFHNKVWQWEELPDGIRFSLYSPDGEGGFPGNIHVITDYRFNEDNELSVRHYAETDCATYITNLIHASVDPKTVQYLAGHESSKITMDIYAKVKYNRPDELVRSMNCAFASWDAAQ